MQINCAPACETCDQLDFNTRCPFDKNAPLVWQPGDLNAMFERITTDPIYQEKHTPQILSQPPKGPWVVVLDNVVSAEECQKLIELGGEVGYEVSRDSGKKKFDGSYEAFENTRRTSTNAVRAFVCVCHVPVRRHNCLSSSSRISMDSFIPFFICIVVHQ
jgi:prolyl 4-hydroxylase